MSILRRLSPLAPWNLLRTLDEIRGLPAHRTQVQRELKSLTKHANLMLTERKELQQELKALKNLMLTERTEVRQELNVLTKQLRKQGIKRQKELARIVARVEQSQAVHKSDRGPTRPLKTALKQIDHARVFDHVQAVVAAAPLESDPCPHIVLDDLLPDDVYDALVAAIPPPLFFEHLAVNQQDLKIPFKFTPRYQREVWQAFQDRIVMGALAPALTDKFQNDLDLLVHTNWPGEFDSMADAGISLDLVAGRVMRRRPGYEIKPHRDPRWSFLTCILYLTRRDDRQLYGTQLCRLQQEQESPSKSPLWIDERKVEVVREVPGRPNSAVMFLNSTGAHRAAIPADAPPETDRYIYQVRFGPKRSVRDALVARLPPETAKHWIVKGPNKTFKR